MQNDVTQSEFHDRWERAFPRAWPVRWHVREEYNERWTRLYTLPEGKLAGDAQEQEDALRRIEAVIEEVIGAGECADIVVTAPRSRHEVSELSPDIASLAPVPLVPVPGPMHLDAQDEDDEPPLLWHASALWRPGLLTTTFREVVGGALGSVLLFGHRGDDVVSPYDGGVDVVGPNNTLGRVRARFREWLSNRPDGL